MISDAIQCDKIVLGDPMDDGIPYLARRFPTEMASVQGTCHEQRCALPPVELPLRVPGHRRCAGKSIPESACGRNML